MSYTPFNAPLLAGYLGDMETASAFSVKAELDTMIRIERGLLESLGDSGLVAPEIVDGIVEKLTGFEPDIPALSAATARDGVVVPELVRQMRACLSQAEADWLHFGPTSQDIIDTALVLRLKWVTRLHRNKLAGLLTAIDRLEQEFGENRLTGRTRMQAALPIKVADRLANWKAPLSAHISTLEKLEGDLFVLQFGGAVGTLDKLGEKASEVTGAIAWRLGLAVPARSWHTDRRSIVEYCEWLSHVTGSLGKIGADIALMAQNERAEIEISDTGGSSAMPHKQNPVLAESLVTLARFNATQISGMHQALVHEQERSGTAWSLEWMLVPPMAVATGAAIRNAMKLCEAITRLGEN